MQAKLVKWVNLIFTRGKDIELQCLKMDKFRVSLYRSFIILDEKHAFDDLCVESAIEE